MINLLKNNLLLSPWKGSLLLGLFQMPIYFLLAFLFRFISLQFLATPMVVVIVSFMLFHFLLSSILVNLKFKLKSLYLLIDVARILFSLTMILVYVIIDRQNIISFAICLFFFYLITLYIETMFIIKLESQKKEDHEQA